MSLALKLVVLFLSLAIAGGAIDLAAPGADRVSAADDGNPPPPKP